MGEFPSPHYIFLIDPSGWGGQASALIAPWNHLQQEKEWSQALGVMCLPVWDSPKCMLEESSLLYAGQFTAARREVLSLKWFFSSHRKLLFILHRNLLGLALHCSSGVVYHSRLFAGNVPCPQDLCLLQMVRLHFHCPHLTEGDVYSVWKIIFGDIYIWTF